MRGYGFTLLEMSIVLIIISVVAMGVMVVFTNTLSVRQVSDTSAKLAAIQAALYEYRVANNRIPCPGDATLVATDSNFGFEAANPGTCTGGSPAANKSLTVGSVTATTSSGSAIITSVSSTASLKKGMAVAGAGIPAGAYIKSVDSASQITLAPNTATASASGVTLAFPQVAEGGVPTRTLKLPDDYAYDGWGRRIMYAVSRDMTLTGAFGIYPGSDTSARMTMLNPGAEFTGAADTTYAAYVLISFGVNGHGSYSRGGGSTLLSSGSQNIDEQQNCDCDSTTVSTGLDGIFVQRAPTLDSTNRSNSFDDIIAYSTRADLVKESSLHWSTVGNSAAIQCSKNSLTCTTVGATKSCACNE